MPNPAPIHVETVDGRSFLIYLGHENTLYIERMRPSGRRDDNSIFQFDIGHFHEAVGQLSDADARPAESFRLGA